MKCILRFLVVSLALATTGLFAQAATEPATATSQGQHQVAKKGHKKHHKHHKKKAQK